MRSAWLSWGLVVLVGAAVPLACGQQFAVTGSTGTGGATMASGTGGDATAAGGGGDTPTSTTTTTTTTSTGSGPCAQASDCSGIVTICGQPACFDGKCGLKELHKGNTDSQVYGDCHDRLCKNAQLATAVNDNDVYDDANPCTEDICVNGVPMNKPLSSGAECGTTTTVCDGQGACVACVSNSDCADPKVCHENRCVPTTCFDGTKTTLNGETDVDCGGPICAPCTDKALCLTETDCVSGVCLPPAGQVILKCITASCTDQVKNGTETAKDCGGPDCVIRCAPGDTCKVPGDCKSGVCTSGKCIAPSCTDGVKNSNETGVDCGANCPACLPGG
ncbi:MAG: hypothetical protein ACMG6S_03465 [Byssovorax sp.]